VYSFDLNPGMDRTGMAEADFEEVRELIDQIQKAGLRFCGSHHYDGQIKNTDPSAAAMATRGVLAADGAECLSEAKWDRAEGSYTSGTPAMLYALNFAPFGEGEFVHRVSPGTIVYNDRSSLKELPDYGVVSAALVLSTVVSRPRENRVTCDAGHKAFSADASMPTCDVMGWPGLMGLKPSEEHLPIEVRSGKTPPRGELLHLLPAHVCPTVNNFDKAVLVCGGKVESVVPVTAGLPAYYRSAQFPPAALANLLRPWGYKVNCVNGHRKDHTKETRWLSTSNSSTSCWRITRTQKTS
jgi:D-serine deaminase-like pyridoxal phosphate-dependent protein